MIFLESEMTLDLRFHAGRQVGQQPRNSAIGCIRRAAAPGARQHLLQSLHQSDGRAMLVMQRLADPIGEAHRGSWAGRGRT